MRSIFMMLLIGCVATAHTSWGQSKSPAQKEAEQKRKAVFEKAKKRSLWASNPKGYYEKYVKGHYAMVDGKAVACLQLKLSVFQIVSDELMLANLVGLPVQNPLVAIRCSTKGLTDNSFVEFRGVHDGTYQYTNVMGALSTIQAFRATGDGITFEEFSKLKSLGEKFGLE